ncbi:MAG: YncE family protein [Acidimicrobiales bacterium]
MPITVLGVLPLPQGADFDHACVHPGSGRVFVAHTAADTIEVLDGPQGRHIASIHGCPDGSGALALDGTRLVAVASRGRGQVLLLDAVESTPAGQFAVGTKPNGLAYDPVRQCLLVADVGENAVSLHEIPSGRQRAARNLPGRPRWCSFDAERDRFLIAIRDPAEILALDAGNFEVSANIAIPAKGPHGLDLSLTLGLGFTACDDGQVVAFALESGEERFTCSIGGSPDVIFHNDQTSELYVATAEGVLAVVDTAHGVLAQTVPTGEGAKTFAFDSERQRLYVFVPEPPQALVLAASNHG